MRRWRARIRPTLLHEELETLLTEMKSLTGDPAMVESLRNNLAALLEDPHVRQLANQARRAGNFSTLDEMVERLVSTGKIAPRGNEAQAAGRLATLLPSTLPSEKRGPRPQRPTGSLALSRGGASKRAG